MEHRVEICMITTPDGAIDIDGRSGPLGGPPDQRRLAGLREAAAVVMVGAGTVRAERYGPPSRSDLGIGVVTTRCDLDFDAPLFSSGAGFVITTLDAPPVPVDSVRAGTGSIDFAAIIASLPAGIVHVEGGPTLNAALLDADLVDALNITFSPHLAGARGPSLSMAPHVARRFVLESAERIDRFVFARYVRSSDRSGRTTAG